MWKQSLTTTAALLAAVLAATAAAAQERPVYYNELTPEGQAEVARARVDSILADTTRFGKERRRHARFLLLWTVGDDIDERGRTIAFEALIRAFEAFETWIVENRVPRMVGVKLSTIDNTFGWVGMDMGFGDHNPGGPGREYVRKVFRTWKPPPPEAAEIVGWERSAILDHPWCQAGYLLFGQPLGEVHRAYGGTRLTPEEVGAIMSMWGRPQPPPRRLSRTSAGSGPWEGTSYIENEPSFTQQYDFLYVHPDLTDAGPDYRGADQTCGEDAPDALEADLWTVNRECGTTSQFSDWSSRVHSHEEEHQTSYNDCVDGGATDRLYKIEALAGDPEDIKSTAKDIWNAIWEDLRRAAITTQQEPPQPVFWQYRQPQYWDRISYPVHGHSGTDGC